MQNSSRYLEVYQAAALMGAAVVPLDFRFTASEVEYVVNHSGARALLFDDASSIPCGRCERGCPLSLVAMWLPMGRGSRDTFV